MRDPTSKNIRSKALCIMKNCLLFVLQGNLIDSNINHNLSPQLYCFSCDFLLVTWKDLMWLWLVDNEKITRERRALWCPTSGLNHVGIPWAAKALVGLSLTGPETYATHSTLFWLALLSTTVKQCSHIIRTTQEWQHFAMWCMRTSKCLGRK